MKLLLEQNVRLTEDNVHIPFFFTVDAPMKRLTVNFSYSPKEITDEKLCFPLLREGLKKYTPGVEYSDDELKKFMPLMNFVTFSLDSPKGCVGTAHRHNPKQTHIISKEESSRGFHPTEIVEGQWRAVLSTFYLLTAVEAKLEVYGE